MPTRQSVEELRRANKGIAGLIQRDLDSFWPTLDLAKPDVSRDALLVVVPALVTKYGDLASTVAADWYDDARADARVRGTYRATRADAVPEDAATAAVRFSAGHLFSNAPDKTLGSLRLAVGKYALQPGRSTIALNSQRERVSWARVPTGAKTCAFCLTMASRGFSYKSEQSADNTYHGDCDCVAVPDWSSRPELEGYDPEKLRSQYEEARMESETRGLSGTLSVLRQQQGIS